MSRAYYLFSLLGFFLTWNGHLLANDLVRYPVGPASWTVNVQESPVDNLALIGTDVVKVEVMQNDQVTSNQVTCASGASRVTWGVIGTNLLLMEAPNGVDFLVPSSRVFNIPYLLSVFDWLSPELLQEKKPISYQGKTCFHYKQKVLIANAQGKVLGSKNKEAWIDSKTLLPVGLDDGRGLAIFTFQPRPAKPVVLPEKFKKILDSYIAVMGLPKAQ